MKIFLGIVLGAGLMLAGSVFAGENHGIVYVGGEDDTANWQHVGKFYDYDNGVVCYTTWSGSSGAGISCLHN